MKSVIHVACMTALAVVLTITMTGASHRDSDRETPPPVPTDLEVPEGNKLFFVGHAFGTQNYICLPSATAPAGVAWTLVGPQANLFDRHDRQITTHFLSPNPDEAGLARATWHGFRGHERRLGQGRGHDVPTRPTSRRARFPG